MTRPRILLPTSYSENPKSPFEEIRLPADYVAAIIQAGGEPLLVPPLGDRQVWQSIVSRGHGLLLPGGPDIVPAAYGQAPHKETKSSPTKRWENDSRLMQWADQRRLPVMGICLGMQTINVCRRGTLIQHLPDIDPRLQLHTRGTGRMRPRHHVIVESDTILAGIVGHGRLDVNTSHHQAVDELGRDLAVSAHSEDHLLVEAIEDTRADRFVLGVQWHPEELINEPAHAALFATLVNRAAQWRHDHADTGAMV